MQVTAATDAILDECTAISPTRSIANSRLCTRLRPIFHAAASPISENWNAPAGTRCGRRNDSSRPAVNRIRRNRSWKRIPLAIGVLLSSFVVPDSHCKASAVKWKQMLRNSPDRRNSGCSLFVIGFSILPVLNGIGISEHFVSLLSGFATSNVRCAPRVRYSDSYSTLLFVYLLRRSRLQMLTHALDIIAVQ